MKKEVIIPCIALVALSLVWYGFRGESSPVEPEVWVAKVGDSYISIQEYEDDYVAYVSSTGLPDTGQRRFDFLDRMVSMRLLALDAEERKLHDNAGFDLKMERARQKILIDGYLKTEVFGGIEATEEDLREMYVRVNTRLKARHLFASTEVEARSLYDRVMAGESFEALAQEVFTTPELRDTGGDVGEFGFDEMDWAFEDAAFRLEVGGVSEPVRTVQGYSVIQVTDRFTNPILTESEFAQRKGGLARYVVSRKQHEAKEALHASIRAELEIEFEDEVVSGLYDSLFGPTGEDRRVDVPESAELVRSSNGSWTVSEFRDAARLTSEEQRAAVTSLEALRKFASGLLIRDELVRQAESAGVHKSAAFHQSFERARMDALYEVEWMDLTQSIQVTDDSIQVHMNRFADEFITPSQARVSEILVEDENLASSLRQQATPDNFSTLAAQHTVRPGHQQSGGNLGWLAAEQLGVLAETVFEQPAGSIIGPLAVRGLYAVLLVHETSPARPATLEESRERVAEQLRSAWVRPLVRERAAQLREQIDIEVRRDLLDLLPSESIAMNPQAMVNP